MGTSASTVTQEIRGRIVANPTNLGAAFPYGGTELGAVAEMEYQVGIVTTRLKAGEFGVVVDKLRTAEFAIFSCFMRTWDADMVSVIFPNYVNTGAGYKFVANDSTKRTGMWESSRAISFLFVPIRPTVQRAIYFRAALPCLEETAKMSLAAGQEAQLPVMFESVPSDNGLGHHHNLLANITL